MHDPFNRSRMPGDFTREDRVRLLGEFFTSIRDGVMPSLEARLFVASGALAWLEQGGDLVRTYWKVKAPAGSHFTPSVLWVSSSRGATDSANQSNIGSD